MNAAQEIKKRTKGARNDEQLQDKKHCIRVHAREKKNENDSKKKKETKKHCLQINSPQRQQPQLFAFLLKPGA